MFLLDLAYVSGVWRYSAAMPPEAFPPGIFALNDTPAPPPPGQPARPPPLPPPSQAASSGAFVPGPILPPPPGQPLVPSPGVARAAPRGALAAPAASAAPAVPRSAGGRSLRAVIGRAQPALRIARAPSGPLRPAAVPAAPAAPVAARGKRKRPSGA